MTMYEKIQALCKEKGFEISNIGENIPNLNVTKGSVAGWKRGAKPRANTIKTIAEYFGVSVKYLLDDEKSDYSESDMYPNIFELKTKKIPLLGEIACGQPIFAEERFGSFVSLSGDLDADFCLQAKGDSMIGARIYDGDIVFIKSQPTVENGQIAAIIIDNEATLKRVYYYRDKNKLILTPENPAYEPLVFVGSELEQVRILGKAVAFQSTIK